MFLEGPPRLIDNKMVKQRSMTELLKTENKDKLVDFMTIDVEGAEYTLMEVLNSEFPRSCVIY